MLFENVNYHGVRGELVAVFAAAVVIRQQDNGDAYVTISTGCEPNIFVGDRLEAIIEAAKREVEL